MASQMVVPASRDTLFMRGFSARREIDDIRDYFTQDGGRCSVEFFKESDDKQKLYVALKFDNKDIAKELLNKYDNTDVLGDKITISWFKDLRRARLKAGMSRRRSNWSPDRYDNRGKTKYYTSGRYMQSRWSNNFGTRGRKFDRSSSRSRSRSSSRSRSRSYSPRRSRSRSRSNDSHDGKKHKRHRTTSDSRKESRRSSDKRRSRDRVSRDRSASVHRHSRDRSPEEEREEGKREKRKSDRHEHSQVKVLRSTVTTVERPVRHEAPSDDESDESGDNYDPSEDDEGDKPSDHSAGEDDHKTPETQQERPGKESRDARRNNYSDNRDISPAKEAKGFPAKERLYADVEVAKHAGKTSDRFFSPSQRFDNSPPAPERACRYPPAEQYDKGFGREQDYPHSFDRTRRSSSPGPRSEPPRDKERKPPGGKVDDDYADSPSRRGPDHDMAYGTGSFRGSRSDNRFDDDRRAPDNTPPSHRGRHLPPADIRSPPEQELSPDVRLRSKRSFDDDGKQIYERKIMRERDFDETRPTRREVPNDEFEKRQQRFLDDAQSGKDVRREFYDDRSRMDSNPVERGPPAKERGLVPMERMDRSLATIERVPMQVERGPPGGRMTHLQDRERSPFFDDRGSTGSGISHRSAIPQSFNGGMTRELEKGALGLPHDKMILVREKKEEIEKSYRQDCETFAAVTKMLISKDGVLENKLQTSLRENLKDIGQRCIYELREYIEGLKTDDIIMH